MKRTCFAGRRPIGSWTFTSGHRGRHGRPGGTAVKTPAEEANYLRYSQNEDIAAFLSALDLASKEVAVSIVGRSLPTDAYGARDIFLRPISENGAATPRRSTGPSRRSC